MECSENEKREYPRLYFHYLVSYRVLDKDIERKEGVAVTENLSLGGVMIELEEFVEPGSTMEISIATKGSIITAQAQVCHCVPTGETTFDVGLKFTDIAKGDLAILESLVEPC